VDPTGNRSIGVLTKPDKIEVDTESTTIDILLDRKYELRYGYFVVRTPKQTELNSLLEDGVSPEVARNVVSMNIGLILEYNSHNAPPRRSMITASSSPASLTTKISCRLAELNSDSLSLTHWAKSFISTHLVAAGLKSWKRN
jgi:hypothetical protein